MRLWIIGFFLLITPLLLAAEEPKVTARLQTDEIGIDDQTYVSIEANQKAELVNAPKSDGFELAYTGESQNSQVTIINGKMESLTTFAYNFVLSPKKRGTLTIPPFQVKIAGKTYNTEPLTIRIVKQSAQRPNPQDPFAQMEEFFNNRPKIPELYLKLVARPNPVYQNQQVVLDAIMISTMKEAFDYQLMEASPIRSDKAALVDITDSLQAESGIQRNGAYFQKSIKRYVLFPIENGKIGIAPPSLVAVSPYGQIPLKSQVIGIDSIKAGGGSGVSYIGDITVEFTKPTNTLEAGKAVELSLSMTGSGNLKALSNPYGDLKLDGLYISAPETELKFTYFRNGRAFFRQNIKYTLLAQKGGVYTVPPVIIPYFTDALIKRELRLPSFRLNAGDTGLQEQVQTFMQKPLDRKKTFRFLLFNPIFFISLILLILLPVAGFLLGKHQIKLASDKNYSRKFLANKRLARYLSDAKTYLEDRKYQEFYLALQKGVFYYITDKLNIPAGISRKELFEKLLEKGLSTQVIETYDHVYESCSRNAYSGTTDSTEADLLLDEAKKIFEAIR